MLTRKGLEFRGNSVDFQFFGVRMDLGVVRIQGEGGKDSQIAHWFAHETTIALI